MDEELNELELDNQEDNIEQYPEESQPPINNNQAPQNINQTTSSVKKELLKKVIFEFIKKNPYILIIALVVILVIIVILFLISFMFGLNGESQQKDDSENLTENKNAYYWPIGSRETTEENGVLFAKGDPEETTITSGFGNRNWSNGSIENHKGIDISGTYGETNIIAAKSGKVSDVVNNCDDFKGPLDTCGSGYGNHVYLTDENGLMHYYGHMKKGSVIVKVGDEVKIGQVIGKIGSSGSSTGTHLHFQLNSNGAPVDPLEYISKDDPRPSGGSFVEGEDVKQTVCLTLKSRGLQDSTIVGIMVNMLAESGFDPSALENNGQDAGVGLIQWTSEPRRGNFLAACGKDLSDVGCQIDFFMNEYSQGYSGSWQAMIDPNKTAREKVSEMCLNYEIPSYTYQRCNIDRPAFTDEYSNYVKNGCK